jgi:PAS domain S-box-containing protein
MEESFAGFVITDAAGVIEYVNRSFETTSGYRAAELIGRPIAGLSMDDGLEQSVGAALSAEGRWRGEIKNRRANGEECYLLATIQALRSEGGEIRHYVGISIDITERVKVEEELAEREAYWRALVENAPDHILAVNKDGAITGVNWTVPGTAVDGTVGRTVYELVHEEYHDAWREALAEVFAGRRRVEVEARTIGGPGDSQWYANVLGPVYEGGAVVTAIVSSRNVTARKETEQALAEREAYWRALVENAPDLIAEVDRDGVIARLNRDPVGTTMEAAVGKTVYDFSLAGSHAIWREALAKAFTGGERVDFEVHAADGHGRVRWYATSIAPVCADDAVLTAVVSERDITARKEAEERLLAIATAVADLVVVVDGDGVLLNVLAPLEKRGLLPLPPDDLRGKRIHDFLPPEQAELALRFVRETVSTGRPMEDERLVGLSQGPTWLSARSAPLSLSDGRVVAVVHILDITKRKRLEEELQHLREETEAQAEEGVQRASEYGLTFREITVLSLIARGKSDKEIAGLLGLSPFTVNKHSSNLVRKMGSRSRSQAAARAVREGII